MHEILNYNKEIEMDKTVSLFLIIRNNHVNWYNILFAILMVCITKIGFSLGFGSTTSHI